MPVMWLTYLSVPQLPRPVIGLMAMGILVPVVTASFWLLERPVLRRRNGASPSFATSQPVMTQAAVELEARPT
jgi:hypothetical protein